MSSIANLSIIRKLVQLSVFIVLVYGSSLGAYHLADKITGALPALSCAFDKQGSDLCVLIPFQHQMDHRLGGVIADGGNLLMGIMPTLISLGTFLFVFIFLNKAFCGWICPLGTFQEIIHIMSQKLGLQRRESVDKKVREKIRPAKWFILIFLVFILPLLAGIGLISHDLGDPYCSICPSRILTTLATGNLAELHVDTATKTTIILSTIATILFGMMIALSLNVRQPFCRICPMLALHAVFRKLGLLRLVKNSTPRCDRCGLCTKACPMDITEIHTEMEKHDVTVEDCTLCGRCVEFCPDKDVLQLKYATIPVFSASAAYFKDRKKQQTTWEKNSLIKQKKPAKKQRSQDK